MQGLDIDIRADVKAFRRRLSNIESAQAPFAIARALTFTAKDVEAENRRRMQQVFDRPTRFTLNAFRVIPAKKTHHVALVGFRLFGQTASGTGAESYLGPQEFGGPRKPKRHELRLRRAGVMRADEFAVPARGARLNAFGNIPGPTLVQVLSQLKAFDTAGFDANETARSKKRAGKKRRRFFGVRSDAPTSLPGGVYERTAKGVKALLIFVRQPIYRPRLVFFATARRVARERLPRQMRLAMDEAIRTAR